MSQTNQIIQLLATALHEIAKPQAYMKARGIPDDEDIMLALMDSSRYLRNIAIKALSEYQEIEPDCLDFLAKKE